MDIPFSSLSQHWYQISPKKCKSYRNIWNIMRLWHIISVSDSAVPLGRASGDFQMGYCGCSRVHVCNICGFEPQSAYQFRWWEINPDYREHLSSAARACSCAKALSLQCQSMIHKKKMELDLYRSIKVMISYMCRCYNVSPEIYPNFVPFGNCSIYFTCRR